MAYLDETGLNHLWSKIKTALSGKADKSHAHTLDNVTETADKKIMTSAERTKLSGIATGANNYTHPSTHPASMITGLDSVTVGNADTVDGYHIVVSTTPPTVNDPHTITIVI